MSCFVASSGPSICLNMNFNISSKSCKNKTCAWLQICALLQQKAGVASVTSAFADLQANPAGDSERSFLTCLSVNTPARSKTKAAAKGSCRSLSGLAGCGGVFASLLFLLSCVQSADKSYGCINQTWQPSWLLGRPAASSR